MPEVTSWRTQESERRRQARKTESERERRRARGWENVVLGVAKEV